jgi:hypothetical protein
LDQDDDVKGGQHSSMPSRTMVYEIRIQGQLDRNWSDWFNGLEVTPQENGDTLITGPIPDQAALQGILTKVFNLRMILLSIRRIYPSLDNT